MLILAFFFGCGSPCEPHDGSVDGWCDGEVAHNCITTCADCIDQWVESTCSGTCSVGADMPPEAELGGSAPNMSEVSAWATCSEWSSVDSGS